MAAIPLGPRVGDVPPAETQISVEGGTAITEFDEYTFRAPRPGFFLGDSRTADGEENIISRFDLNKGIPDWSSFFDGLPFELLTEIVGYLDVCSLVALRAVSRRTKETVDGVKDFRRVAAFPKLLGAVVQLQCRFHSLDTLARCVWDPMCISCGHFGDFLDLVKAQRLCYKCWRGDERIWPLIRRLTSMDKSIQLVPGFYGATGNGIVRSKRVIFENSFFGESFAQVVEYNAPAVDQFSHLIPHFLRYMVVIRAPYFDEGTQSFEEGFCCRACAYQGETHNAWNIHNQLSPGPFPAWALPWRRYTRDGMQGHIHKYGRIFRVTQGNGKIRYVHEKPFRRYSSWSDNAQLMCFLPAWCHVSSNSDKYPYHRYTETLADS